MSSDVTALILFHGEGLLAQTSITSFTRCCNVAAESDIKVTRIALLDRPDDDTRRAVLAAGQAFDRIETLDNGDPGASRNAGVALCQTSFAVFFDGDDLWGEQWIARAHRLAQELGYQDAVYHPRVVMRFSTDDHLIQSMGSVPPVRATTNFYIQPDSRSPRFDPRSLLFSNVWSANSFGPRSLYERFPFTPRRADSGFGIEDWTWNLQTLVHGINHLAVPDTVHCVRIKPHGSLGRRDMEDGLVPPIHEYAAGLEDAWTATFGQGHQEDT